MHSTRIAPVSFRVILISHRLSGSHTLAQIIKLVFCVHVHVYRDLQELDTDNLLAQCPDSRRVLL